MLMPRRFWIRRTSAICIAVVLLSFSASTWAIEEIQPATVKPQQIELTVDKAFVLPIPEPLKAADEIRVTIASPEIADFIFVPKMDKWHRPKFIYIKGMSPGETNMSLWIGNRLVQVYDLKVTYNIVRLKESLNNILPDEEDIRVYATHDSIVLSGSVSSAENLDEALALAEAFTPGESKVRNLLAVTGVHQVMLEVTMAEMSRTVAKRMGINWAWFNDRGNAFVSLLGNLGNFDEESGRFLTEETVGGLTGLFRGETTHDGTVVGLIDFLKGNGLIKILAEPTLISLSGQTASFLAGGEFPIPEIDDEGNVGVEYRSFGVELAFTPTVLSKDKISMKVVPAVSELDFTIATTISGARIPGLTTRKAATIVELGDGQSFAIAGLLKETARENIDKYPVLGDIPILGTLFKSQQFQNNETELVILVTPRLVKPINAAEQSLPTDYYIEP
jgi:pilus assembly protein CpaC